MRTGWWTTSSRRTVCCSASSIHMSVDMSMHISMHLSMHMSTYMRAAARTRSLIYMSYIRKCACLYTGQLQRELAELRERHARQKRERHAAFSWGTEMSARVDELAKLGSTTADEMLQIERRNASLKAESESARDRAAAADDERLQAERELERMSLELKSATAKLGDAEVRLREALEQQQRLEHDRLQTELALDELERDSKSTRREFEDKLAALHAEVDAMHEAEALQQERLDEANAALEHQREDLKTARARLRTAETALGQARDAACVTQERMQQKEEELVNEQGLMRDLQRGVEVLKEEVRAAERRIADEEQQRRQCEAEADNERSELRAVTQKDKVHLKDLDERNATLARELHALQMQLAESQALIEGHEDQLAVRAAENARMQTELAALHHSNDEANALLRETVERNKVLDGERNDAADNAQRIERRAEGEKRELEQKLRLQQVELDALREGEQLQKNRLGETTEQLQEIRDKGQLEHSRLRMVEAQLAQLRQELASSEERNRELETKAQYEQSLNRDLQVTAYWLITDEFSSDIL